MSRSMWIAASGMMAQQLNIDVISNNMANVNTIGYKKSRADFEDLMYQKRSRLRWVQPENQNKGCLFKLDLASGSAGVPKVYNRRKPGSNRE